jgi:D-glucosaminate-specific PTS system IIB component
MAEIVLNRIDCRLIHGQVMTGWLQRCNANTIWIVDDKIAKTPMMIDIFSFAAPAGIKIEAFTVEEAIGKLASLDQAGHERIILMANKPRTFVEMVERGYKPQDVNYGGMGSSATGVPTTAVAMNCNLTDEEIRDTDVLQGYGTRVWIQLVPSDRVTEWSTARRKSGRD